MSKQPTTTDEIRVMYGLPPKTPKGKSFQESLKGPGTTAVKYHKPNSTIRISE